MDLSRYNYYYRDGKTIALYNFLSGKISIFSDSAKVSVEKVCQHDFSDELCVTYFKQNGYIADCGTNETLLFHEKTRKLVAQSEMLSLIIFPTEFCNFRCTYCCQDHKAKIMSGEVQKGLICFIERYVGQFKVLRLEWFGGEPLLQIPIIQELSEQIIDICRNRGVAYYATMTTNGYMINASLIKKLRQLHILTYQITLDGMEAIHDSQRKLSNGQGTWRTIVDNLIDIRDNAKTAALRIVIRTNITKRIAQEPTPYITFLKETFGDDQRFSFIFKLAQNWGNIEEKELENLCWFTEYKKVVSVAIKQKLRNRAASDFLEFGSRMCEASMAYHFVIFPDGHVSKCAQNLYPEKSCVGTLEDIEEIGEKNESVFDNNPFTGDEKCNNCFKQPLCLNNGCKYTSSNSCAYEMEEMDFLLESVIATDDSLNTIKKFAEGD